MHFHLFCIHLTRSYSDRFDQWNTPTKNNNASRRFGATQTRLRTRSSTGWYSVGAVDDDADVDTDNDESENDTADAEPEGKVRSAESLA